MARQHSGIREATACLLVGLLLLLPACQQSPRSFPGAVNQLLVDHAPPAHYDERFTPVPQEDLAGFELPAEKPYRVGPGDVLVIQTLNQGVTTGYEEGVAVKVKRDGTIRLPKIGSIQVEDKTPIELENLLIERFEQAVVTDPVVNVDITQFDARFFFVVGQVATPGKLPANGRTTLLESLLQVGGTNLETADLEEAYVIRDQQPIPFSIQDIVTRGHPIGRMVLEEFDIVFVPHVKDREDYVYVFGEVRSPLRVPMEHEGPRGSEGSLTLAAALAAAGGLDSTRADINSLTIYRGGWQCPRQFRISLQDMYRHGNDIHLAPGDRIAVGTSGNASFQDAIGPSLTILSAASSTLSLALSAIALTR